MTRNERVARDMARAAAQVVGDTGRLQSFRILRFGRHREGYFHAEVSIGTGDKAYVHCKWGSWFLPRELGSRSGRTVLSPYSDVLCERMRSFERAEIRAKQQRKENILATATSPQDAARLLRMVGYEDDEITDALVTQFKLKSEAACGILAHVDKQPPQEA